MSSEHEHPSKWFDLFPPRGGIGYMAACFIAASLFLIVEGGDSWYTRWVCPWFLPLGIGLWLKHTWARWAAIGVFVLWTIALIAMTMQSGFTAMRVIHALVLPASFVALWEWKISPDEATD